MDGLEKWEAAFNKSDAGRIGRGAVPAIEFTKSVNVIDQSQLNFEKDLGVFWPVPMFEERFQVKAVGRARVALVRIGHRHEMSYGFLFRIVAQGQSAWGQGPCRRPQAKNKTQILDQDTGKFVAGVVLPSTQGCPTGCIKMTKQWFTAAQKVTHVASSDAELRAGQTKEAFAEARRAVHAQAEGKGERDWVGVKGGGEGGERGD